ncbi:MAG TPA: hypothetical protein VHO67_08660 [Polyangia bacterium]|nr:hypothetical protein [Polyangia bacterium]
MNRPTKGQRYRAKSDLDVRGIISYSAPFTGGFRGTLPAGATLTVEDDPPSFARGVYLRPDDYRRFESLFVSADERGAHNYSGYAVVVTFEDLESGFDRLDAG